MDHHFFCVALSCCCDFILSPGCRSRCGDRKSPRPLVCNGLLDGPFHFFSQLDTSLSKHLLQGFVEGKLHRIIEVVNDPLFVVFRRAVL